MTTLSEMAVLLSSPYGLLVQAKWPDERLLPRELVTPHGDLGFSCGAAVFLEAQSLNKSPDTPYVT